MAFYQSLALIFFLTTLLFLGLFFACRRKIGKPAERGSQASGDSAGADKKLPEKKAGREVKLLDLVIDNIWHGVMIVNRNREVLKINESLSSLFYLSKKDVLGKKTITVFNNNRFEQLISQTFESLAPQRKSVVFYGDQELYLDIEAFPVTPQGELIKKGSKDYEATGLKLVILAKNNTQEVEFSKLRSQFVANVSHEMRTPLTSIKGYLETVLEDELREPDRAKGYLSDSLKQVVRLNHLIEDVLNLSKIEYKRNVLLKEKVDIVQATEETVDALRYLADQNEIEIGFSYSSKPVYYITDPDLFRQLVKNLVENSIFHAGKQSKLSIRLDRRDDGIYIDFMDNGVGISKADLPFIFQRFYRGKSPFSSKRIGSGLGLSIVKHIVDLHNGRIKLESRPNIETVFKVFFPAS
ncbi:MAG: ATP-binding protein [Actinomycetota bacterium]